ncbi:ras-specific guanine nucleotide-releasing factor 2 isoform X2 [Octopus bimaculoides]|uniref:ras-specific guanine nucleotide-releasing factor 2 isoform X2 n=1 Tax=Octopus bimaculoides TaxID=37653 RepID=UPI0022DFA16B|nr:ras-specific guanine nucleotide-releasing factor 2 isoform X2 [Octopus bimaculoides]
MQKAIRFNESQILYLAQKARQENTLCGYLYKKSSDTGKWQLRWFILYQNFLFYYENDSASRPSGVALLEGSYCDRAVVTTSNKTKDEKQFCFSITYHQSAGQRQYDLKADTEADCIAWIEAIRQASYSKMIECKEELEQKHLHLLQILDSERQAKWHYVQQTEEHTAEIKKLKNELLKYKAERKLSNHRLAEENEEIRKIKKVQSFFRGWLCRRRWKQIVELYIRSPHAESMRKRNSIVFNMVESEEEYNRQLSTLVTCFLRPFRMAASSKKPPITHEDVNSIFLNSETLLFLHQIFLKGLSARLENWPTLVLGDLFDILLPMLCIYQEYVRNHHYSLQVLAEYKQKPDFNNLLKRYEEKPLCEGRSVEIFLTHPMHQIPRYIITLHELLAHTPHDHVEREKLEYAQSKLEELSRIMHDEVSETENIRKNLAVERMIIEGCDILLDVNQTFIRQGLLLQLLPDKPKNLLGLSSKREVVRQVFLFSNHMLLTSRASNGRLHLAKQQGKIPLIDCTLIEDPSSEVFLVDEDTYSLDSVGSFGSQSLGPNALGNQTDGKDRPDHHGLEFRLIIDSKSGPPLTLSLVAATPQEKAAWCSEISQCIENLHYSDLLNSSMWESSSVTMPQSVRHIWKKRTYSRPVFRQKLQSDPKLFRDDVDIKFSRTLNSCRVPQIRHATVDRLLDRLTDLRFLSIDFLNTFLLTYKVFTTGYTVLEALRKVYRNPDCCGNLEAISHMNDQDGYQEGHDNTVQFSGSPPDSRLLIRPQPNGRRISTGCMRTEITGDSRQVAADKATVPAAPPCTPSAFHKYRGGDSTESEESQSEISSYLKPSRPKLAPIASCETLYDHEIPIITTSDDVFLKESKAVMENYPISLKDCDELENEKHAKLLAPSTTPVYVSSSETLYDGLTHATLSSTPSTDTLTPKSMKVSPATSPISPSRQFVPNKLISDSFLGQTVSSSSGLTSPRKFVPINVGDSRLSRPSTPVKSGTPISSPVSSPRKSLPMKQVEFYTRPSTPVKATGSLHSLDSISCSSIESPTKAFTAKMTSSPSKTPVLSASPRHMQSPRGSVVRSPTSSPKLRRAPSPILGYSYSSPNMIVPNMKNIFSSKRGSAEAESISTPRSSFAQADGSPPQARAGTVVTSSRQSKRRSSSSAATTAFAAATAGSTNPLDHPKGSRQYLNPVDTKTKKRESVLSAAATMRVLNVMKHWVSKHYQDFDTDAQLKAFLIDLLEEMVCNTSLLPAEHKAAAGILRIINQESQDSNKVDLDILLAPPATSSTDTSDSLSALDIAEQLTYLDHKIFIAIRSDELLSQTWMKPDKEVRAPHVHLVTKRFNEVSRLVVSEIVGRTNIQDRVACLEKWAAIADICRCMHNYNGVLQICAAFVNSSVFRMKKMWERISKQTRQMIDKLQTLVSSEGRFKNMRDALHRCDPPCIPYLGMYLTDLSFIEEGTPNFTDEKLVNFSKMRMIAHVIREIQVFQQTPYRIEHHPRVTNYLLDPSRLMTDEEAYRASLEIEPKQSRLSVPIIDP